MISGFSDVASSQNSSVVFFLFSTFVRPLKTGIPNSAAKSEINGLTLEILGSNEPMQTVSILKAIGHYELDDQKEVVVELMSRGTVPECGTYYPSLWQDYLQRRNAQISLISRDPPR